MASAIEICNLALTRLGADAIRSFDEDNKRARLSQVTYTHIRDLFLEDHEWTFNTKYAPLALLSGVDHPYFTYIYRVPSDCLYPRAILSEGTPVKSTIKWEVFSNNIGTNLEDAWLRYSEATTLTGIFPRYFIEAVAAQIAAELAPAIVQDKQRYNALTNVAEARLARARDKDAELGVEYRFRDNDPDNDTFVYPPGGMVDSDGREDYE